MYVIYSKQDVPQLYTSEASEYALLSLSARSVTGSGSFTSTSSAVTYNYSSGLQDLYNQLYTVLQPYTIVALEWNTIRSWIDGDGLPLESGFRQAVTRDSNNRVATATLYTSSGMTTKVVDQIITRGTDGKVSSVQKIIYDTNGTTVLVNFTDAITRDSNGLFLYQDRIVTIS